jgi:hypothetical protein
MHHERLEWLGSQSIPDILCHEPNLSKSSQNATPTAIADPPKAWGISRPAGRLTYSMTPSERQGVEGFARVSVPLRPRRAAHA